MKERCWASALGFLAVAALSAAHAQNPAPTAAPIPTASAAPSPTSGGAALFDHKCALCHGPGGTGTLMIGLRLGKERGLLTQRTDLTADFVRAMVRSGLRSMPPLTRVEVTDSELKLIAAYLSHTDPSETHPEKGPSP